MYAQVTHRGALLPASSMHDPEASSRLFNWVKGNCENLGQRLTVVPNRGAADSSHPLIKAFTKGGSVETARSSPRSRGGPVIAAHLGLEHMGRAISATPTGQTLICLEWSESYEGWASAVGAYNAETDQIQPPIDDDLIKKFKFLLMWDTEIMQGAKRGRGRDRIHPIIRELKDAGLSEDFVVAYALGLGLDGRTAENLALHYREV